MTKKTEDRQEKYPQHVKLRAIREFSQEIGEFLDWLGRQGISLVKKHEHSAACEDETGYNSCGYRAGERVPLAETTEKLLARFFEIDLRILDDEKRQMLDEFREASRQEDFDR